MKNVYEFKKSMLRFNRYKYKSSILKGHIIEIKREKNRVFGQKNTNGGGYKFEDCEPCK